jgi:hypothetical protein
MKDSKRFRSECCCASWRCRSSSVGAASLVVGRARKGLRTAVILSMSFVFPEVTMTCRHRGGGEAPLRRG